GLMGNAEPQIIRRARHQQVEHVLMSKCLRHRMRRLVVAKGPSVDVAAGASIAHREMLGVYRDADRGGIVVENTTYSRNLAKRAREQDVDPRAARGEKAREVG